MTRSVARPSNLGALWAGNPNRGFTVGNCFLRLLLEDFLAKDVYTARNRWRIECFCAETIPLVRSYTVIE